MFVAKKKSMIARIQAIIACIRAIIESSFAKMEYPFQLCATKQRYPYHGKIQEDRKTIYTIRQHGK